MADVIDLAERRPSRGEHAPLGIDVTPVPLDQRSNVLVYASHNLEIADQRRFSSMCKAMTYAAALSAKHGCPIIPHGAAADYLGENL